MKAWILAARPKTLPAAAVPVWVGAAPALLREGGGSWPLLWFTLASCLCIQVATNLFNDAIDHEKGADTAERLGPVRASAAGLLPARAVLAGALGFCLLAALAALPLIQARGWPVLAIGTLALLLAYGYTGGPVPLAYRGLGELFVVLFFGFGAVLGSHFVQTGELGGAALWAMGLQCGLYSGVLLAVNNLRDITEDRRSGKRTLAVRFGEGFARAEIAAFCFAPLLLWPLAAPDGLTALALALAGLPLAALLTAGVFRHPPGRIYNRYLGLGAAQLLLFGALATWLFRPL